MTLLAAASLVVATVSGFGAAGVAYAQGRHGWAFVVLVLQAVAGLLGFLLLFDAAQALGRRS